MAKNRGACIYWDNSSKGKGGKRFKKWRADITIRGVRYRKRSGSYGYLEKWLVDMKGQRYGGGQ
jgi:hypothetical protein